MTDIEFSTDPRDLEPEPDEEEETPHRWDAADEGDFRYDLMVEDQMDGDRHTWPGNRDVLLISRGEDEMERARRRAPIRDREAA